MGFGSTMVSPLCRLNAPTMVARASSPTGRVARRAEAVPTGPLGALSHDELGVIFDGLADPLEPAVAVALSSTCVGLRTPLQAALEVLKGHHGRAAALCRKVHRTDAPCSCALLRDAEVLFWRFKRLTADDMATLAMILRTNRLTRLRELLLAGNGFGDAGMRALCDDLGSGAAPSLRTLGLRMVDDLGPAGAEALAAALGRGVMPKLEDLYLGGNPIGCQGVAALAAPLRKLPVLTELRLGNCEIDDEGMASLVANLGKDDFKTLEVLSLYGNNEITQEWLGELVAAIDAGMLPKLRSFEATPDLQQEAVLDALRRRRGS